ncbi:MAG: GTP 3',8-cyclase MoaA [Candidatus Obscuribacterales bacterium]|nr:GTP 3',8-cyclase MoaA [Candidatus Obscuribacterales bacterium]
MNKLIDNFGRKHTYLRISVTDKCNLRCFYCLPRQGLVWKKKEELLSFEEIERISRIFVSMGIEKIRLTGGEPLMRKDLPLLASMLSRIEGLRVLAMTTNASRLKEHAFEIRRAGITQLNISLDSLKSERFEKITGRDEHEAVMDGLKEALSVGFPSIKLNVVAIAGVNDDEILDFVALAKDQPLNVRFIEFMPFKNNDWQIEKVLSYKQMLDTIGRHHKLTPIKGEASAVAKDYAIEGATGTVSFVTSMSESFCSTCNRLRLTADGSIKSCLFYPSELTFRDRIRSGASDQEIEEMILESLSQKPEAHLPAEEIAAADNRAMIEIGG